MSLEVTVEPVIENQIQEVTLDGQEIYVQPLSFSENLTKLAHKIDFSRDESETKGGLVTSEITKPKDEVQPSSSQLPTWPWESMRNKLRQSLTEVGVLLDVLNVSREKKYLVLDPILLDNVDVRPGMASIPKKRGLGAAGTILSDGSERLKKGLDSVSTLSGRSNDFYNDLVRLRQKWRIKKVGNNIIGDVGYKSAGSRYPHNSTFEVTKADTDESDLVVDGSSTPSSAIDVTIPGELEGSSYLHVSFKHISGSTDLSIAMKDPLLKRIEVLPTQAHWQLRLEAAQNVIFCKELFNQLAHEAMQQTSPVPHIVIGNHILCHLFPGVQLSVFLSHQTKKNSAGILAVNGSTPLKSEKQSKSEEKFEIHSTVLEHSLHQLLREHHHLNSCLTTPHPITATFASNKRRRLAGPSAFSPAEISESSSPKEPILQQIIKQAKHMYVVRRVVAMMDDCAKTLKDVLLAVHASSFSSPFETVIKITLSSIRYEITMFRTVLQLFIAGDVIYINGDSAKSKRVELSHEEEELRDFVNIQIAQHQTSAIQQVARSRGWHILASNMCTTTGETDGSCISSTLLLRSPNGANVLSVRCSPVEGTRVMIQRHPDKQQDFTSPQSILKDPKWNAVCSVWREVHLEHIDGWSPVLKLEYIFAILSDW